MWPLGDNDLFWRIYDGLVRDHLPRKISVHNGVPTRAHARLFDPTDEFPDHEGALINALRSAARTRDDIVIVGGGIGISTVVAARMVRPGGTVTTFEASASQLQKVRETIDLNLVQDLVTLRHGVVGPYSDYSKDEYGSTGDASRIQTTDIPECDLLELDCEGAEVEIIREMNIQPQTIIVETHGFLGTNESSVRAALNERGYVVEDRKIGWEENGIYILTATLHE